MDILEWLIFRQQRDEELRKAKRAWLAKQAQQAPSQYRADFHLMMGTVLSMCLSIFKKLGIHMH